MLAYHNDNEVKEKYLRRIQEHRAADTLLQNCDDHWKDGKGGAIGCTIHGDDDMAYETELGIPIMLARLENRIFEGLPVEYAKQWPAQFLRVINIGADLSLVGWKFLHWLLTEQIKLEGKGRIFDDARSAIGQCADVLAPLKEGGKVDTRAAENAICTVHSAARAARAAYSAASATESAYHASRAAYSAADSAYWAARAAYSAENHAYSADIAESAAHSAASAARAARAAYSTDSVAYSAAYAQMADKLLELNADVGPS